MDIEPKDKMEGMATKNSNNATGIVASKVTKMPSTAPAAASIRATKPVAGRTKATTTTVTKITKLVLKPRTEPKSRLTLTTTQHFSRQTATSSSMKAPSSLDKTYQIRNNNAPPKRLSTNSAKRVAGNLIQDGIKQKPKIASKENKSFESNKQEIVHTTNTNIQLSQTKTLNKSILEEITSTVVNASPSTQRSVRNSMAFEIQNTPKKRTKPVVATDKSTEKCKRKSYDPLKARQFIREQQEKRKLRAMEKAKESLNQEEIKKRLDNLRKNSLNIVNKNVKRARSSAPALDGGQSRNAEERRKSETCASSERRTSSLLIMSQQSQRKRIGILRRPDGFEDRAAAPKSTALTTPLPRGNNTRSQISPQPIVGESAAIEVNEISEAKPKSEPKMDLEMPLSVSLKSSLLMTNLATPNDDRNNEMRFWLRPTPVQPYPYNFIMAVRKKLELVTHPVQKSSSSVAKSQSTLFGNYLDEPNELPSPNEIVPQDQSKSQESSNRESLIQIESEHSKVQPPMNSSHSEEYSTNFSSVTLKTLDRSQTHADGILTSTKISSQQIPNEDSQDTLSISSGILSHSSPEKRQRTLRNRIGNIERQPTPLSTNHADSLHIVSRSISQHSSSVNGQTFVPASLDVQKMLNDFNQSLSQVIRVNQQLHTVLSNPPSLRPASVSEQHPTSTEEYSDDVNNFASDRPTDEKTSIDDESLPTATPSEQIPTEGESISESITATHSELERRQSSTIKESEAIKSSIGGEVATTVSTVHASDDLQTQFDERTQSQPQSTRSFQKRIFDEREAMNTSIGSDIFTILKQTAAIDLNSSAWSESNVSYSNLGMCEQLIQSETQKTEHLAVLLKLREKSLIDRFKGQIVWLELQKQKLKAKGMTAEISVVKKKQRALLVRLVKDRKELHRLMKLHQKPMTTTEAGPNVNYQISHLCTNMNIRRTSMSAKQYVDGSAPMQAMKAIELPANSNLEIMLQKREHELRMRREHVEKLLGWHQRLDVEEQEIMKMEQMVMMLTTTTATNDTFNYTKSLDDHVQSDNLAITVHRSHTKAIAANQQSPPPNDSQRENISSSNITSMNEKREKHIRKIEKSLQMLHNISVRSVSSDNGGGDSNNDDEQNVEVSGRQLNRLWKRLTGQLEEKFSPKQVYTLTKVDLEELYEEAKLYVLKKFHAIEINKLINDSINNSSSVLGEFEQSAIVNDTNGGEKNITSDETAIVVPTLDLNHSSSTEDVSMKQSVRDSIDQGYYFTSESTAENRVASKLPASTASNTSIADEEIDEEIKESTEDPNSGADGGITPSTYHDSEDMHSDITEDSLNKTKIASQESETPIASVVESATQIDESMIEVASSTTPVNETQLIEDISFPHIDVTVTLNKSESIDEEPKYSSDDFEKTKSEKADDSNEIETEISNERRRSTRSTSPLSPTIKSNELEQRLIDLDDSLKDLNETISRSPVLGARGDSASPDIETPSEEIRSILSSVEQEQEQEQDEVSESIQQKSESSDSSSTTVLPSPSTSSALIVPIKLIDAKIHPEVTDALPSMPSPKYTNTFVIDYNKMPEAEALRRTPVSIDTAEKTTLDQSTSISFPFLREIPNKPPPPYPTHRHPPKTTLPSDERIKEIVFQNFERLHEVSADDKTFIKSPSPVIASPNGITTIVNETNAMFERIIVDVCEEIMNEFQIDQKHPSLGKQPIAFYKPPDRLQCLQQHAWHRVKKLLGRPTADGGIRSKANATNGVQQMNARCLPSQMANMTCNNRRKRDMVDEILIQELYEDEPKWTNFDLEEQEVRINVKDLSSLLADEPSIDENQTEDVEGDSSSTNESKSTPTDSNCND